MAAAAWILEKINSSFDAPSVEASFFSEDVIFVSRKEKPNSYVGVVSTSRSDNSPVIHEGAVQNIYAQNSNVSMMIAIPRSVRWSGTAMEWLEGNGIAFGGVGDLLSAVSYDDDMSKHRNKTFAFVSDGLRRHSRVGNLEWMDSKKVRIHLRNNKIVTVALDNEYDITMTVARNAARVLGDFDILLKTNPNGSISSNGAEEIERLGFQTLAWGELFGFLAKEGR